jgi:hypothetical protein
MNETDKLILDWNAATAALETAKEIEKELRKKVAETFFKAMLDNPQAKGTFNHNLGNGYKIKSVFTLKHTLNNENNYVDQALEYIEKMSPEGKIIAEKLVKWKPELSGTEYENLAPQYKAVIDTILITKSFMQSIEFVEPKAPK